MIVLLLKGVNEYTFLLALKGEGQLLFGAHDSYCAVIVTYA